MPTVRAPDTFIKKPFSTTRSSLTLAAAGLVAGFGTAALADTEGWYIGAEAGATIVPHIKFEALANSWQQTQQTGYEALGQVGYGFGQVRLEGEVGYRQNALHRFTNVLGQQSASGNIGGVAVMGNAYYDFSTGGKLTPFLGVGLGGLDLSADKIAAGGLPVTNGSDFVFAYQGIAGLAYAVNDNLAVKLDYRYLRSEKGSLSLDADYGTGNGRGAFVSHAFLVGFTYQFGRKEAAIAAAAAPPPPPPPARAPAPPPPPPKPVVAAPIAKNFMVFFDFDKDAITPEARQIIVQAAEAAKSNHSTVIALTGYTDLAGTIPYNLKLSVRRGNSVRKLLEQLGIPAGEITVVGKGKSDPLVPTKDGVREAQNRRVTIVLE